VTVIKPAQIRGAKFGAANAVSKRGPKATAT
jgi:hypothetical protein